MTTPDFWDPTKTWQTPWMTAPLAGYDGGSTYFKAMTPQQRADWWKKLVNDRSRFPQYDYEERMQWENEITVYGPLLPGLGFMVSGRYLEGVGIYPGSLKYNPDMTVQGWLDWSMLERTRLSISGMFTEIRELRHAAHELRVIRNQRGRGQWSHGPEPAGRPESLFRLQVLVAGERWWHGRLYRPPSREGTTAERPGEADACL